MKPVFFLPHLGLGDHFTFNGALREIYKEYNYMVMPVKENNLKVVRRMFSDLNNLYLIPIGGSLDYSDTQHLTEASQLMNFYKNKKFTIKSMGYFNGHYDTSVKKYDELFYEQVGVNFKKRWESFSYPRNEENEQKLFKECFENLKEGEYVFLHDDPTRCAKICKDISHKDTLIFVHDYRQRYNKENYKEIENYLNFISEINNLAFFSIKK
jgi:hypothetical protein